MKPVTLILSFLILLLAQPRAEAANVQWNFLPDTQCYLNEGNAEIGWNSRGLGVSLMFSTSLGGNGQVKISNVTCYLETLITWTQLLADDIADAAAFGDGKSALFSTEYSGASGEMTVDVGQPFYLAFQAYELVSATDSSTGLITLQKGSPYYGWVQLEALESNTMTILASAIDLDGGAMVVGGGGAIPEPTAAMLVLVGLAGLALRRRRA